jgi:DNA invertase Pin-like site-specific DNA recombinase
MMDFVGFGVNEGGGRAARLDETVHAASDAVRLFDLFDNDDISLIFLDLNIETGTGQGSLLRHVVAAFAVLSDADPLGYLP